MYVYFDKYGKIKEIISEPIRQGSSNNKIYVYFEGDPALDGLFWAEQKSNGVIVQPEEMTTDRDNIPLPYDLVKDRDLKYFNDYLPYNFWVITLGLSNLNVDGLTLLTIRAVKDDEMYAQGLLTFEIEHSVINFDNYITQSQYDYLLRCYLENSQAIELSQKIGVIKLNASDEELTDAQFLEAQKEFCIIEITGIDEDYNEYKEIFTKDAVNTAYDYIGFTRATEYIITGTTTLVFNALTVNTSTKEITRINRDIEIYEKSDVNTLLGQKQDTLVNQSNIKSVNGSSLLGSGDLDTHNVGIVKKSIGSSTVSLSDSEIAELQKDYAIIVDTSPSDKPVYIKKSATSSQIEFIKGIFYQYTNNWFSVNQNTLIVNLTNKTVHKVSFDKSIYDKNQVDTLISGLSNLSLKREIVASLPVSDISANTIYMILDDAGQGANVYNEYLYINNNWELLGTSKLDYKLYDLGSTLTGHSDIIAQLRNATSQCVLKYTYNSNERFYYERYRSPATPFALYFENIQVSTNSITRYVLSNTTVDGSSFVHNVYQYPYLQGLVNNWHSNTSYVIGNLVCYNSKLYKCNTNHTSGGSFDTTKFDETDLETLLNGKLNASRFGFIEINTSSGTLTQEQQDEAHKDFCVIHDTSSDFYYIKSEYDYGVDITFRFIRDGLVETLVVDETDGSYSITTKYLQTYKHTITFTENYSDYRVIIHSKRRTAYTLADLCDDFYNGDAWFVSGMLENTYELYIFSFGADNTGNIHALCKRLQTINEVYDEEFSQSAVSSFTDTLSAL